MDSDSQRPDPVGAFDATRPRRRFGNRVWWIAAGVAVASIPALLVYLLDTPARPHVRAGHFALATTPRQVPPPPPDATSPSVQRVPLASRPTTAIGRPAPIARREVKRVHPVDRSDPGVQDDHLTIVKYYDARNGRYQMCVTNYHDRRQIGHWNTEIDWSDHVTSPKIPLPGNGKTNCTAWRPQHIVFTNVVYDLRHRHWIAALR